MIKQLLVLLAVILLLNSCASIFNPTTTNVKIYAPRDTQIIYKNDTTVVTSDYVRIQPKRSKDSLRVRVAKDSIDNDFAFKRRTSGLFYFNFPFTYGLGFLVDLTNQKRFTYRKTVNLKLDSVNNSFYVSEEKLVPFKSNDFFLYTSPLMAIDAFSLPMLSLGGEYFFTDDVSISAEAGVKYTKRLRDFSDVDLVKNRGHSFRMELKWYNIASIARNGNVNEYLGIEARFLRHQFTDAIDYQIIEDDLSYYRTEAFIVQKKVNVFNIKYGLDFPVGKQLYVDIYTGFGIRFKNIKNPYRFYDPEKHRHYFEDDLSWFGSRPNNLEENGNRKFFNFSLGFKFGVKL